jgi:hypothetical protein
MVMTSRPSAENPTASDYDVPSDPGKLGAPGSVRRMEQPRVLNEGGTNIIEGEASSGSTANTTPDRPWPMQGEQLGGQPGEARNSIPRGSHRTSGQGVGTGAAGEVPEWRGDGCSHPAVRGRE